MSNRPGGTYRVGTYGEIERGEWFMDAESDDGWLYAADVLDTEQTRANPHVRIVFASSDAPDATLRTLPFPAYATAGIVRPG
ncbi:hypothetical protein [Actinomadura rudentiformis]|uniref:hypothetical protein n=1 Tax=Actinomadura rudentiformis TaxID=359158 RepID=UPI00178C7674|nr:hypothetical protein [Actinomadura rudentiformis]